jgi:ribosomal protein L40E
MTHSNTNCSKCPVTPRDACLAVLAPERFGWMCKLAATGDEHKRQVVIGRSAIGLPSPMPGLSQKAKNLAVAVAQHAAAGFPMATEAQRNARLAICRACEHFEPDQERCRVCGCGGLKLWWAEQSCPLDPPKWGPVSACRSSEEIR